MAAYLEGLLEINFLHPPSKYGDDSLIEIALRLILSDWLAAACETTQL